MKLEPLKNYRAQSDKEVHDPVGEFWGDVLHVFALSAGSLLFLGLFWLTARPVEEKPVDPAPGTSLECPALPPPPVTHPSLHVLDAVCRLR